MLTMPKTVKEMIDRLVIENMNEAKKELNKANKYEIEILLKKAKGNIEFGKA